MVIWVPRPRMLPGILYCDLYCNPFGRPIVLWGYQLSPHKQESVRIGSGCGVAGAFSASGYPQSQLAERTWAQGVVGSNPIAPTKLFNNLPSLSRLKIPVCDVIAAHPPLGSYRTFYFRARRDEDRWLGELVALLMEQRWSRVPLGVNPISRFV
jgi:hypothetical protein